MEQMSALDAFFLHGERPRQAMNLSGLGIYDPSTREDGSVTYAKVMQYGAERTRRSALFRRKLARAPLASDQPYWIEDSNFDIRRHVFHTTLKFPGGRRELDEEMARINAMRIDRDRPLWEWWLIDGLETIEGIPSGCFGLLFKLHHAAFDGVSGWEVIAVSHDTEPGQEGKILSESELPPTASRAGAAALSTIQMGFRAWQRALMRPLDFANTVMQSAPIFSRFLKRDLNEFPLYAGVAPATPLNAPLSNERCHRKVPLSLTDLKYMRALAPGSTVNDVILTVISGALRRYLQGRGILPAKSLNVGVPISIRASGTADEAGNKAVLAILPLATDIADPVERLRTIYGATDAKKEYVATIPAHLFTEYLEYIPGILMDAAVGAFTKLGVARAIPSAFNLIVTNVPASRVPIYFAGAKMLEYDAAGPIWDGAGMLHTVTSYLDTVNISFFADSTLLVDPDSYQKLIREEIAALLSAATAATAKTGGPKSLKVAS